LMIYCFTAPTYKVSRTLAQGIFGTHSHGYSRNTNGPFTCIDSLFRPVKTTELRSRKLIEGAG
jgi:hypothetical protein